MILKTIHLKVYSNDHPKFHSFSYPSPIPEIESIFKKWLEIEVEIYCIICRSYCKLDKFDSIEYLKCNCGTLNLKDDEKFF